MKPAPFDYVRAQSVDHALDVLAAGGDVKLLAGGQSLVPAMNFRLSRFERLVDLNPLAELAFIRLEAGELRIGALTRQRAIETSPLVREHAPLLTEATRHIAHAPIRSRGTLGGSLAHADPAAEDPAVMLALEAQMVVRSVRGERIIPAGDFFRGVFTTALAADELLTEVRIPAARPGQGFAFEEQSRRLGDFAIVGVAVAIETDGKRISRARLAVCGVGDHALRLPAAEQMIVAADALPDACRRAAALLTPQTDLHASADYRTHLTGILLERAITRARGGAA